MSTACSVPGQGTGLTPCMVDDESPRASSPKPGISWGKPNENGEIVSIRNTVIDVESGPGLEDVNLHDGGARTWSVSAFGLGGLGSRVRSEQPLATTHEQDEGTPLSLDSPEEPLVVIVTPDQSLACADIRGPDECCQPEALPAQTSTPAASAAAPDQSSDAHGASVLEPLPISAAPGLVLLQVPLQLNCGTASLFRGSLDTSVAVLSQELDPETGSLSVKLNVTLKPPAKSAESPVPNVLPQPWLQEPKAEAKPQQRKRPSASPGITAAEKRDGVCCHWKNGWCRYGEACKFNHPAEMCGVDSKNNVAAGAASYLMPATAAGQRPSRGK